jgi:hypothetical protein
MQKKKAGQWGATSGAHVQAADADVDVNANANWALPRQRGAVLVAWARLVDTCD